MTNTASTFYPQLTGSRGPVTNICQHVISLPLPPDPPLPRLPAPTPTLRIGIIGLVIGVHLKEPGDQRDHATTTVHVSIWTFDPI